MKKENESNQEKANALTIIPKSESTAEEKNKVLLAEIEKLKAQLKQQPQSLEEKIEYFQVKQQKIKQLAKLEESSEQLFNHMSKLDELATNDDFKCDKYSLAVNDTSNYKEVPVFQMNNPVLIRDVIKFVLKRIEDKVDVLKMEIAE